MGILFGAGIVFTGLSMWSSWENNEVDQLLLSGKAHQQKKVEPKSIGDIAPENIPLTDALVLESDETQGGAEKTNALDENQIQPEKKEPDNFTFVAIGDAESYGEDTGFNKELIDVMKHAQGKRPDFALFTGDILSTSDKKMSGNTWRIKNVKDKIDSFFNNYYIAFGKHDIECGNGCVDVWNDIFFDKETNEGERKLYYSFDYLNTHFVLLSTDYPIKHSVDRAQLSWLDKDLEQNSKPNTIVVQHVSPISFFEESSKKCHDLTCSPEVKKKLMTIYRKYKVDCVISGHENAFDHKIVDGIDFILSGNSGNKPRYKNVIKGDIYSYFTIDGESINLQAFNTKNKIIREIKVK